MCMPCLMVSALTLFTPSGLELTPNRASQIPLAQDTQVAIAAVVDQLPATSETQILRNGLESLQGQLADANSDVEAKAIIDRELTELSEQIAASPNNEQMVKALESLMIEDEQLTKQLKVSPSQVKNNQSFTKGLKWGWLH